MKQNSIFLDFFTLCKPKVVGLMLITTWVGMHLATTKIIPYPIFIFTTIGIALSAASAAVLNHLADRHIDIKMSRTEQRPIACGRIVPKHALWFAIFLAILGLTILTFQVNSLTALLTFSTMLGYAVCYTLFLKRATPQNIVIGGAAGATPPLLGWTAITGEIQADALLLVLIIFTWTPPHFWALAIYRIEDYQKANIPMLPVTHGIAYTKLITLLYTLLLFAVSLLPFVTGMSGNLYLIAATILGLLFIRQSYLLYKTDSKKVALKTFSFSIVYLLLLFIALMLDHHL
jgi:heme o synthase